MENVSAKLVMFIIIIITIVFNNVLGMNKWIDMESVSARTDIIEMNMVFAN